METKEFFKLVVNGTVPDEPPDCASPFGRKYTYDIHDWEHRHEVAKNYGMWAIVDKIWTKQLADWIGNKSVLEVMAGSGWLAKALIEHGINIVATDNNSWKHNERAVFPVIGEDARISVENRKADILIVSWPPYEDDKILEICEKWGNKKPIVYIGEDAGGCNAPNEFFDYFEVINPHPHIGLLSWPGIHDSVQIGYWK